MALISKWYLCRSYRVSKIQGAQGQRGNTSRIFKFITSPVGTGGFWFGRAPVLPTNIELAAITVDTALVPAATLQSMNSALQNAPDDEVFDIESSLSTVASSWPKRQELQTKLEERLIDTGRMTLQQSVRSILRDIAAMISVQMSLGYNLHAVPLDSQFDAIVAPAREAFLDYLEEQGFTSEQIGQITPTTTFRSIYRFLVDNPRPHWLLGRIASGEWHLGHPNANLQQRGGKG